MTIEELPLTEVRSDGCGCGAHEGAEPMIDASAIPHRIRHAAVLGAAQVLTDGPEYWDVRATRLAL